MEKNSLIHFTRNGITISATTYEDEFISKSEYFKFLIEINKYSSKEDMYILENIFFYLYSNIQPINSFVQAYMDIILEKYENKETKDIINKYFTIEDYSSLKP